MRNMEAPAVLHYAVGEQITDHFDFVDPDTPNYAQELARNGQRVVTFLVYLNDDYEGGVTGFPTLGFSHKGRRGEGLYFVNALPDMQPDLRMVHTGIPPPGARMDRLAVHPQSRDDPTSLELGPDTHVVTTTQDIVEARVRQVRVGRDTRIRTDRRRLLVEHVVDTEPHRVLVPAVAAAEVEQVVVRRALQLAGRS